MYARALITAATAAVGPGGHRRWRRRFTDACARASRYRTCPGCPGGGVQVGGPRTYAHVHVAPPAPGRTAAGLGHTRVLSPPLTPRWAVAGFRFPRSVAFATGRAQAGLAFAAGAHDYACAVGCAYLSAFACAADLRSTFACTSGTPIALQVLGPPGAERVAARRSDSCCR